MKLRRFDFTLILFVPIEMHSTIISANDLKSYYQNSLKSARYWAFGWAFLGLIFFCLLGHFSEKTPFYGLAVIIFFGVLTFHRFYYRKTYVRLTLFETAFPALWKQILGKHSVFYRNLNDTQKTLFERRVQIFLAEKRVEGIETEVDDEIKLIVAASGIIPTFAFPTFNYPTLNEVLVYPASFSQKFEIGGLHKHDENIEGMVGNGYMNHSLLLSKPALLAGFNGRTSDENVGIHEFVHLLDREDGVTDGVPERLIEHRYTLPWLHLIKEEMDKIKSGSSDINPYAITNNAEFLAVVSEYFFSDPEEFHQKHPELYSIMSDFYDQKLSN